MMGSATFIGKGPQPLLWAGLQAACVKGHSKCMANALYHCVILGGVCKIANSDC